MIIAIGTDIVEIARITKSLEKFGKTFEQRIFTDSERSIAEKKPSKAAHYAKRFAAKEAAAKELGTGFSDGVSWHDIEISSHASGKPLITLYGKAKALVGENANIHLSLSDDAGLAIAYVLIESP